MPYEKKSDKDRELFRKWFSDPHPQIKYFSAAELLTKTDKGKNSVPPIELWANILPTIQILDRLRDVLGYPIHLHSVYRNKAYNASVDGAKDSMHLYFNAVDFSGSKGTYRDWYRTLLALIQTENLKVGGLAQYPDDNFVHLDTRTLWPDKGRWIK